MTVLQNLRSLDYDALFSNSDPFILQRFREIIDSLVTLTAITEGSGVPTQLAQKHDWYFDTAASKYYRNTDGGTTWVALN